MKAIVFEKHGGVEQLCYTDVSDPTTLVGEALVRVKALALNGFDPMILKKIPGLRIPLPMIPGGDVAGVIERFGPETRPEHWSIGDRVLIDPLMLEKGGVLGETVLGGAAEFIVVPVRNLIRIPQGVSFENAAALPIAYGTAHRMMLDRGQVTDGDKVLILGASGGVGTCCIQLAKMKGAEVAACTSSEEKGIKLKNLGADHIINVSEEDYVETVRRHRGRPREFENLESGGATVIVNYDGGESWAKCFRALSRGGRILTCGATNGYDPKTDLRYIWSFEFDILGSNGWRRTDLEAMLELVRTGKIKPVLHSIRPLSQLPISLNELINRGVVGKAILVP